MLATGCQNLGRMIRKLSEVLKLHQIKAPQFYTNLGLRRLLNPPVYVKNQRLFKAFECFSSSFQGKFYFQGLFKTVLYIQVLFKSVRTLVYKWYTVLSQGCAIAPITHFQSLRPFRNSVVRHR